MAGADLTHYLAGVERSAGGNARLVEELRDHLEDAVARHRAAGLSEDAAVRRAIRSCGSSEQLAAAVRDNDESGRRIMAATRWTGLAGILAVPMAVLGILWWSPATYLLTMALAAAAVVGLLAAHWRHDRWVLSGAVGVFGAGMIVAAVFPQGPNPTWLTAGLPAVLTLAAVCLLGVAFLRRRVLPVPAVGLAVAGVALMLGLNTILYLAAAEPPYLVGVGAALAVAGWVWMNASLALRGFQHRAAAAV